MWFLALSIQLSQPILLGRPCSDQPPSSLSVSPSLASLPRPRLRLGNDKSKSIILSTHSLDLRSFANHSPFYDSFR